MNLNGLSFHQEGVVSDRTTAKKVLHFSAILRGQLNPVYPVTCVGLSKKERKEKKCNDLGNKSMVDGYNFIGRGLIQLTGRYHYERVNKEFKKAFPNQGNLVDNPELLE